MTFAAQGPRTNGWEKRTAEVGGGAESRWAIGCHPLHVSHSWAPSPKRSTPLTSASAAAPNLRSCYYCSQRTLKVMVNPFTASNFDSDWLRFIGTSAAISIASAIAPCNRRAVVGKANTEHRTRVRARLALRPRGQHPAAAARGGPERGERRRPAQRGSPEPRRLRRRVLAGGQRKRE